MTPNLIENLNRIKDKITLICGDQRNHIFDASPNPKFNFVSELTGKYHIVGGMFGGHVNLISKFYNEYYKIHSKMVELNILQREEQLLTLLYNISPEDYHTLKFTTWHHEESDMSKYNKENEIYFYKIFENLN